MTKKYALCLYGKVGSPKTWKDGINKQEDINYSKVFKYWKKNFLDLNDVDIFIHSWSFDQKKQLVELWKPTSFVIQKQKYFSSLRALFNMFRYGGYKKPLFFLYNIWNSYPKEKQYYWNQRIKAARSRWFSTHSSLSLALKHDTKYDFMVSARLDLVLNTPINLDELDASKFYSANFNNTPTLEQTAQKTNTSHEEKKLSDLIFFSRPEYMKAFIDINENFYNYPISPHKAAYQAVLKYVPIDEIQFYLYPFIDFDTAKGFFYKWKMGDN